jgi:predicted RecB family nuclease
VDEKMNSDTLVTNAAFEAFLHCETKAYLVHESTGSQSKFDVWEQDLSQLYKKRVSEWLISRFGDDEVYVGTPSQRMLKQGSHRIVLHPLIKSSDLWTEPDALWRTPVVSGATSFRYSPVRFVRSEKVSRFDKLKLAFDALALNRHSSNWPGTGKLIYGSRFNIATVALAKLSEKVRHTVTQVLKQQKSRLAPPLVLNKLSRMWIPDALPSNRH